MNSLSAGTRLGPYEVVAPAGAGGMGEVWRARDTRLERSVAIKVLPKEFANNAQLRLRFEREAKSISQLNHPHICTLYDVGQHGGFEYLVMEFIEGETLADRLSRGPLPLADVIRYGVEIAAALDRAHKAGIVHRDLKPGNIMITKTGVKLLDFGLAKESENAAISNLTSLHTEKRSLTEEGTIVGTFQYMAPEQLEGQPIDHRADIFALGAVLYEMATGRRAFEGKSRASLIAAILATQPAPISTVQPMTPAALERVIRTCLDKDPDERFQSAHDVRMELQWITAGGNEAAAQPARRGRRETVAWSLAALLALVSAAVIARGVREHLAAKNALPIRTSILPPDNTTFEFVGGPFAPPEISPDGTRIVFGARTGANRTLWVRALDSHVAQQLSGTENASYPFWSPDGRYVAFFADGKLKKVEAGGGAPVTICDAPDGRGGTWNREGVIVFGERYTTLYRVNAAGGSPAEATLLDRSRRENSHRWPCFLPDQRHFFFLTSPTGGDDPGDTIEVGSLDDKKWRKTVQAGVSSQALYFDHHILFVRDGILTAQQFDEKSLTAIGDPIALSEQQITSDTTFARRVFSIAGNGTLIYQTGEGAQNSQLAWFDRTGKPLGVTGDPQPYGLVRISPDARAVAVGVRTNGPPNIWTIDTERGVKSRLTFGRDAFPVWSPDGKKIAYGSRRDHYQDIYIHDLATGSDTLLVSGDSDTSPTSWSADGSLLFYNNVSRTGTSGDIMYVTLADGQSHVYLRTPAPESNAAMSSDGKWVAYQSNESGTTEIYVAPFPPTGAKWPVSNGTAGQVRWRGDGKELYFIGGEDRRAVTAVSVTLGAAPQFGPAVKLFDANISPAVTAAAYDVTRDGQRFLVNSRIGDAPPPAALSLVQNFGNELRAAEAKSQ